MLLPQYKCCQREGVTPETNKVTLFDGRNLKPSLLVGGVDRKYGRHMALQVAWPHRPF